RRVEGAGGARSSRNPARRDRPERISMSQKPRLSLSILLVAGCAGRAPVEPPTLQVPNRDDPVATADGWSAMAPLGRARGADAVVDASHEGFRCESRDGAVFVRARGEGRPVLDPP